MAGTGIEIKGLTEAQKGLDKQKKQLQNKIQKALLRGGLVFEGEAKRLCPVDTGRLRDSIQSTILKQDEDETVLTVGTAVEYAGFVEFGTGIHAENGQGRKTPWMWKGDGKKWGGWHRTTGQPAQPFIRPAFEARKDEAVRVIADSLKKGGAK